MVAAEIGRGGSQALKRRATEAVNERLRPVRARRAELLRDREALRAIVRAGSARAREVARQTLEEVAVAMHTRY